MTWQHRWFRPCTSKLARFLVPSITAPWLTWLGARSGGGQGWGAGWLVARAATYHTGAREPRANAAVPASRTPACRWLLLASLPALLGAGAAGPSAQGVTVSPTAGTYPGAPRSVQILDVTLPSGQHLWFDRDLCRTFAWKDTDNTTTLASPVATSTRWPVPDITVYQNYPGLYSGQLGGFWASDWGSAWQPHFQGYTTTATSVTFTCDFPTAFSGASPEDR